MVGKIFNIQRFCTMDGPGIRTTVFLKGCPLRCKWCHNPESHSLDIDLSNFNDLACYSEEVSTDYIVEEVLKDKDYYDNSGGGVTLSGGEPFFQSEFCLELLQKLKDKGLHICVETSGYAQRQILEKSLDLVDIYLFDYKITDGDLHKKYTGVDNGLIIDNLKFLDANGKKIILRCPIIPTVNDTKEHFKGIGDISNLCKNITLVVVEPYHDLGVSKYVRLGKECEFITTPPTSESVLEYVNQIQKYTNKKVKKA